MSGHTAGPWKITEWSDGELTIEQEVGVETVASIHGHFEDDSFVYPTARLIKAAPDLLEAAKALMGAPFGTVGDADEYDAAMHRLEAAIARAEPTP